MYSGYNSNKHIFEASIVQGKRFLKKGRGFVEQVIFKDRAVITTWLDNKPVALASNVLGGESQSQLRRWDKAKKTYVMVNVPSLVGI